MGKVSPNDGQSKTLKQKKQSRSTKGKYLRPGALAQLRYTKVAAAKSCTDLGKKRVIVITSDETKDQAALQNDVIDESPIFLSPMKFCYGSGNTPIDVFKQNKLHRTPKTPGTFECTAELRFESLPTDLLIISNDLRREKRLPCSFKREVYNVLDGKEVSTEAYQLTLVTITTNDKFGYGIETVEEEEAEEEENVDVSHTREYNMEDDVFPPSTEEVGSNPLKEGDIKDKKS